MSRSMFFKSSVLILASLLIVLGSVSFAVSAFEFHPRMMLSEEYDDNIYLTESDEEEDWITVVAPGFQLLYESRSVDVSVDYSLHYKFYKNNSEDNLDNFEDVQRADATALFFSGRPFTLRLSEVVTRDQLDDSERYAEYNDIVNRSTVYRTTVAPEYRQSLGQTMALVLGYSYNRVDWVEAAGDDTEEHIGRVSLEKNLSSMTTLFGSYAYRLNDSDSPEDEFDRNDYSVGFRHQLGKRTSVSAEVGFSTIEYDSGYDTESTTWNANAAYQLTGAISVNLNLSQDFTVSATQGLTKTQEVSFGLDYNKETISGLSEIYWSRSDYVRQDREDIDYGVRLGVSTQFSKYFTGHLNSDLEFSEYQEDSLDEDAFRYTLGASLDYLYRRFVFSCGYRYRVNNSDIDRNDYTNNVITLSGTMRF